MSAVIDAVENRWAGRVAVFRVEAEKELGLSTTYGVTAVPLCVLILGGEERGRVQGMDALELDEKMRLVFGSRENGAAAVSTALASAGSPSQSLDERLDSLINTRRVMLFMKGEPDNPRCGFSQKAVSALRASGCNDFGSFDILEDQDVRQGLKERSKWPTYPQLYVDGELLGGCDIILELFEDGSLKEHL
jgi:Grx4 family monothiol glutaredoxin